jgi:hypothetical protein
MARTISIVPKAHDRRPQERDNPDYSAHPLLDPLFFANDRNAMRHYVRLLRENLSNPWRYQSLLNRLLHPVNEQHPLEVNERIISSYLRDANAYIDQLVRLLPAEQRKPFLCDEKVASCNDFHELVEILFSDPNTRRAFEARRKLYLARVLIQIDRTRRIQEGPRHKRFLLSILDKELWAYVRESGDVELSYAYDKDGVHLTQAQGRGEDCQWFRFNTRRVVRELPGGSFDLPIYHVSVRFKLDGAPVAGMRQKDRRAGDLPRIERVRSASVLSKMLRKRINDPVVITDILGLRFVVKDEKSVHALAELLHHVLGGPLAFRNQVDLFRFPEQHREMNRFSSREFKVFKEDVDVLYAPGRDESIQPYIFPVELQILTVESYLRSVRRRDDTSHREYKRRQFLEGVFPYVFPTLIYGAPESVEKPPHGTSQTRSVS